MSNIILNGGGSSIEGRIERLQILREDGTIRESRNVNIHNTIVDCGLDNILTVGGFADGEITNNNTIDLTYYNSSADIFPGLYYDLAKWVRLLWFVQIGTDTENTITTYDMTSLVSPYVNADQETYSQSHYIPTTSGKENIRGTTSDSYKEGDIHSTHRITSNSVKVTEDNTEITEVAFFVGINKTWTSVSWENQSFSVGDMFCRINLGDNKITLNKGERLVITYALSEYAGMSSHQAIDDIHLVDSNNEPIKFIDDDGNEHTIGAIARCWMCDGRNAYYGTTDSKLPGGFKNIYPTMDRGYTWGISTKNDTATSWNNILYKPEVYSIPYKARIGGQYICPLIWIDSNRVTNAYMNNFRVCCGISISNDTSKQSNIYNFNQFDKYGFPNINTTQQYLGSNILLRYGTSKSQVITCGRTNNNISNPTPYNNYTGYSCDTEYEQPIPTIKPYTRGTFYRDQEWVISTYAPRYDNSYTTTLPSPLKTENMYWLFIRGMIYKLGYFTEKGNLDSFVPCPIVKKAGQVFRITFREHIGRHEADTTIGG